jgi:ABC-type antimicrobial peptide transport system, ATPase component
MVFLGMQPVIRVTDLWKYYGDDEQGEPALRGTSLEVAAGDIVALFGRAAPARQRS